MLEYVFELLEMAKRGPKTREGKEAVSKNATAHGIYSQSPVIVGIESEEDWKGHVQGVKASLQPQGQLESELAERIAGILWRLRRVTRYESAVVEAEQAKIAEDYVLWPQSLLTPTADQAEAIKERMSRERLLPPENVINKVTRYEAHLHRQLMQTLHELEAMQSRRLGAATPLARLDITTSSPEAE
jgi:hypothetical protein